MKVILAYGFLAMLGIIAHIIWTRMIYTFVVKSESIVVCCYALVVEIISIYIILGFFFIVDDVVLVVLSALIVWITGCIYYKIYSRNKMKVNDELEVIEKDELVQGK